MATDPRRVKELFIAALEVPDLQDRQAFLERECAGDADLRQRLEALLKAHENPASVLERPLAAVEPPAMSSAQECPVGPQPGETGYYHDPGEEVGSIIAGRYKLLEQIGEGGMGTVWVAEQTQPVRRKVALKLIKAGMDSKNVLSRFEAERQALALMDHPNIAKVLDGGTTENGRPFFVMEYVKGVPFTRYCDDARLSIAERLALFVPVCHAVQHAHQKGIIHRDLKPSNILICLYDGKPVPKVIDFGLAKAMHQPLTEHTLHTAHGAMLGTPLYMSPEQAEFNNLDVDTRTDIYALGVILYELLTGTTPLEKQRFQKAAWHEILRLIKEEEPPRPSARLSGSGSLPSLAAQRQLEPVKLAKLVRGELDWIVMKCLEKDRSRRYDTANGLARDVECYLSDEVVEARPPSTVYRLRKLVRKHRTALAMAAAILLLLVAGVAISTWQAVRATRAEWQTTQERDRAIQSEREANAMIQFFKELTLEGRQIIEDEDDLLNKRAKAGSDKPKTLRNKRMDEAVNWIDSEKGRALFADYPLAEAEIREWIANLAFPTEGEVAFSAKWNFHTMMLTVSPHEDPEHPFTIRYEPLVARRHLQRALELRLVHLGTNDLKTLETMRQLGRTIVVVDAAKGLELLTDCLARSTALFGLDDDETARCQQSLAQAYDIAEKPAESVQLWKAVYSRRKAKQGSEHNETLELSDRLADAYEKAGRVEDALHQRQESLKARRKLTASSEPGIVVSDLRAMARLYEILHDYQHAEALLREVIGHLKDEVGINGLSGAKFSLGHCLLSAGKPAEAETVLRECLAIRQEHQPEWWETFDTKSLLGRSLLEQNKYADAEPLLLAGYEGMKKATGVTDAERQSRLIENAERLVQLYEATGKKDKADTWRKKLQEAKKAAKNPAKP
jgi:eukaryotic-like serine/threonine-protein kinase